MRKTHFILLVFFTFFWIQCSNTRLVKNPDFTIVNAVYYTWVGGQKGVGGTNIKIYVENASAVNFGAVYFRGKQAKLEVNKEENKIVLLGYFPKFKKNRDLTLDYNPTKELKNEPPSKDNKIPFELSKNEIVISYSYKEKIHYYKTIVVKSPTKQFK